MKSPSTIAFIVLAVLVVLLHRSTTVAQTQPQAVQTADTTARPFMCQYIGISASTVFNQRTTGLLAETAAHYGNAPLTSVGLHITFIGDLLLQSNRVRSEIALERFLNTYPSGKVLENLHSSFYVGYNLLESPVANLYPLLGFGNSLFYIDTLARMLLLKVEGGMGADFFVPNTGLKISAQLAYSHSFNYVPADGAPSNQPGLLFRLNVSLFLRKKYSYLGFD